MPKLDRAVWRALKGVFNNPRDFISYENRQAIQNHLASDCTKVLRERQEIMDQLEKTEAAEKRLLKAYTAGAITVEQLKDQLDESRSKRAALTARLADLRANQTEQPIDHLALDEYCSKAVKGLAILGKRLCSPPKIHPVHFGFR